MTDEPRGHILQVDDDPLGRGFEQRLAGIDAGEDVLVKRAIAG